jgi:hypothetical protein
MLLLNEIQSEVVGANTFFVGRKVLPTYNQLNAELSPAFFFIIKNNMDKSITLDCQEKKTNFLGLSGGTAIKEGSGLKYIQLLCKLNEYIC